MCGIVGAVGATECTPFLLSGLKTLEYRGYDSAGLALLDGAGALERARAKGRVSELERRVAEQGVAGYEATPWFAMVAPPQLPTAIAQRLQHRAAFWRDDGGRVGGEPHRGDGTGIARSRLGIGALPEPRLACIEPGPLAGGV